MTKRGVLPIDKLLTITCRTTRPNLSAYEAVLTGLTLLFAADPLWGHPATRQKGDGPAAVYGPASVALESLWSGDRPSRTAGGCSLTVWWDPLWNICTWRLSGAVALTNRLIFSSQITGWFSASLSSRVNVVMYILLEKYPFH